MHMSSLPQMPPNTNICSPVLLQSRKDKERLKQKHKKRPDSPSSILTPPVVPTADKVLLPTAQRDGHSSGRQGVRGQGEPGTWAPPQLQVNVPLLPTATPSTPQPHQSFIFRRVGVGGEYHSTCWLPDVHFCLCPDTEPQHWALVCGYTLSFLILQALEPILQEIGREDPLSRIPLPLHLFSLSGRCPQPVT